MRPLILLSAFSMMSFCSGGSSEEDLQRIRLDEAIQARDARALVLALETPDPEYIQQVARERVYFEGQSSDELRRLELALRVDRNPSEGGKARSRVIAESILAGRSSDESVLDDARLSLLVQAEEILSCQSPGGEMVIERSEAGPWRLRGDRCVKEVSPGSSGKFRLLP